MSTYRRSLHHIVFATKHRLKTLEDASRRDLFAYIYGICTNLNCHVYRIGGYRDHVHLLIDLHPTVALADLIHKIKLNSSRWMKDSGLFPAFEHWQDGYAAFTVNWNDKAKLTDYILTQEDHHKTVDFLDEFKLLCDEVGIEIDEKYLP